MAPNSKSKVKSRADDDFILTLSDDENPAGFDDFGDEAELDNELQNAAVSGTKRKREQDEVKNGAKSSNKKAKKQAKKDQKNGKTQQDATVDKENEEMEEEVQGDDDGALDPEFEFDIGGAGAKDVIEDFDGWANGDDESGAKKNGNKKGVDIDEIIARRQQVKKAREEKHKRKQAEQDSDASDNDAEGDEGDGDFANFDDDELLAADGFGMGAGSESEEDQQSAPRSDEESEDGEEDVADEDDSDAADASDDESVASQMDHPDDMESADESDDEDVDAVEAEKRKAFFAPEEKSTSKSESEGTASFQSFNLSRPILRGLAAVGFSTPTPIQRKTIPVGLLGKDVVGGAVTGSGKTAAFIIPILERLLYRPRKVPTSRVAILMPTRELAVQCYNVATKLATYTDITFCQLVGGFSLREQENVLKKRPDVIIATPGRFIDHMRNSASFTVDTLEILVLDEADRMLEDGFADELNEILTTIPKSRQTMLFSATMTNSVDKLIRVGLNRPVRLMVDSNKHTVGTLIQEFVRLRPGREDKRLGYLMCLCSKIYTNRVIIFFRQKKEAHRVRIIFGLSGLKAAELHGSLSQEQRIKAVEDFRDGRVPFLLATDVASRGLDIKGVETVINYEAPQSHEIYLHRIGRTARAGRSGRACTIAAEPDRKVVKAAVKAGKSQGAKISSRIIDPADADTWAAKAEEWQEEVDAILKEEKAEKQMAQVEMQVTKGENLIRHEDEIMSRPKRTWFETEREKLAARKMGLAELNGEPMGKKSKRKLSNKDKKKLDDTRDRKEGRMWKKGKSARETKGGAKPSPGKGKGKPKGKGGKGGKGPRK